MTMEMGAKYFAVSFETTYRFSVEKIPIETFLRLLFFEIKILRQEVSELRNSQQKNNEKLKKTAIPPLGGVIDARNYERNIENTPHSLPDQNLKPEIETGGLATYSDGTIRYNGSVIPMRDQLNDLCRMFISRPNQLVLCDEIREEIVRANRRETTTFITIAKYVSELHGLLKRHFGKTVILNHKKEGWRFVP